MVGLVRFAVLILLGAALVTPSFSYAQNVDGSVMLRAEIRNSLLNDPRARELTEGELNSLVSVLAEETEAQELALDFLPPPPPFITEYVMPLLTPWGAPISTATLYGVILLCLGAALLLLKRLLSAHKDAAAVGVMR